MASLCTVRDPQSQLQLCDFILIRNEGPACGETPGAQCVLKNDLYLRTNSPGTAAPGGGCSEGRHRVPPLEIKLLFYVDR